MPGSAEVVLPVDDDDVAVAEAFERHRGADRLADLGGDKLADLIHEELVELGHSGGPVPCEHFRDDEKLFTFRSRVPVRPESFGDAAAADISTLFLRAYEACFRRLGDMEEKPD